MDPSLNLLLASLSSLVVGRVVLALLPAGWPGRHDRRELHVTLAASFVLGSLVLTAQGAVEHRLGIEASWLGLLAWFAVGIVRIVLLPGALRPRHEPPAARTGLVALALFVAGWIGWIAVVLRMAREAPLALALYSVAVPLAGATLAVAGLERARRAPWGRALAWCLVALLAWLADDMRLSQFGWIGAFMALGASGTIAWLRRADERGLALAAIGFAGVGMSPTTAPLALAGLVATVLCTPAASRLRALVWATVTGGVVTALVFTCMRDWAQWSTPQLDDGAPPLVWLVPLMALPMTVVWVRLAPRARSSGAIEAPRRELVAGGLALSLSIVGAAFVEVTAGRPSVELLPAVVPAAIAFLLLAFAPAERAASAA